MGVALLAPAKGAASKGKSAEDAKKAEEARRALSGGEPQANGLSNSTSRRAPSAKSVAFIPFEALDGHDAHIAS